MRRKQQENKGRIIKCNSEKKTTRKQRENNSMQLREENNKKTKGKIIQCN